MHTQTPEQAKKPAFQDAVEEPSPSSGSDGQVTWLLANL